MVVIPTDTTHEIKLIPRVYPSNALIVTIANEFTEAETILSNVYYVENGYMFVMFDFDFTERDNYRLTISSDSDVIYRGNLFATAQDPQDFKLSQGVYLWVIIK